MKLGNMTLRKAHEIAERYYSKDKYEHALRVVSYLNYQMIPKELHEACAILALMHDLIEDTSYDATVERLSIDIVSALSRLTHVKEFTTYKEYIQGIRAIMLNEDYEKCAWWVKLADMKDHLMQTETLTDKLKEKYLEGLAYLL